MYLVTPTRTAPQIATRLRKLHERIDKFIADCDARATAEGDDRARQYTALDKAFAAEYSRLEASAVALEARLASGPGALLPALAADLAAETAARNAGDVSFRESMLAHFGRLQRLATELFGAPDEEGGEDSAR